MRLPDHAGQTETPLIRGGVPTRNPDFTGRESLLRSLRQSLVTKSKASVLPQTLHGLGGVGKTQLALEYVYLHADDYDLVWWISAEQLPLVLASLEDLGKRLQLPIGEDRQQTARTVRDWLSGNEISWLLIFDNADNPDDIAPLVPPTGGHVVITSRNQAWASVWAAIEVDVFERDESVALVKKRGRGILDVEANQLAAKLGDLPLALDQAASWQATTGMPVSEYLDLFDKHVNELMGEGQPPTYRTTVAAFVSLAFERLHRDAPAVAQLLEMFAFLGAEPISVSLLRRARAAEISEPLNRALREPIFLNQTIRDLRRYGLARVDPNQRIQVHRLVQLVLREQLSADLARQSRTNVHNVLAAANPGDPDDPANWPVHAEIGPHMGPAGLVDAETPEARQVVLDGIRYLWNTGDYEGARRLGEIVVPAWRDGTGVGLGEDGEQTLIATRHLSQALRSLGDYERARTLTMETYERFRQHPDFGPDHEHTIVTANQVGVALRLAADYRGALHVDRENIERAVRVFGEEDPFTMRAKSNMAVSLRMLGDFAGARDIDEALVREWRRTVGEDDPRTLFCIGNLTRDLYGLGQYADALDLHGRTWRTYRDLLNPRHTYVLWGSRTSAIAQRKIGSYEAALEQARETHRLTLSRFGPDHEDTLAAKMTFANSLRTEGKLVEAKQAATDAVARYGRKFGKDHGLTLAAVANLAIILRALGELREARSLDEATLAAMRTVLGPEHPYTLCVANNLANDLVLGHELTRARELSSQTYETSRRVRGDEHPYTLACAVNAAFDMQATGDEAPGQDLLDKATQALAGVLGEVHPETLDAGRGKRAECDIEPPPT